MCCSGHGEPLQLSMLGHSWQCVSGSSHDFPAAALITELTCPREAAAEAQGDPAPDALTTASGTPPDEFSRLASVPMEEFYNEYDVGDPAMNAEPVSFSYGEHVETCAGIDFAPFVERAENRARFHYDLLASRRSGSARAPFTILRRDWRTVPETLVVVVWRFAFHPPTLGTAACERSFSGTKNRDHFSCPILLPTVLKIRSQFLTLKRGANFFLAGMRLPRPCPNSPLRPNVISRSFTCPVPPKVCSIMLSA
jgi:hypothetical protein